MDEPHQDLFTARRRALGYIGLKLWREEELLPSEEVLSLTDLCLVEAMQNFDPRRGVPFMPYAITLLKRTLRWQIRRERRLIQTARQAAGSQQGSVLRPPLLEPHERRRVRDTLETLSPTDRRLICEHLIAEHSVAELARVFNGNRWSLQRRLDRLQNRLQVSLRKQPRIHL